MTDHAVEPIDDTLLQQLRIQLGILVAGDDPDETKAGMFAIVCELADRRTRDTEVALMKDAGVRCELFCNLCGAQHVDAPEPDSGWLNPPHRTHTCHACGNLWRPYPVATFGVESEAMNVLRALCEAWDSAASAFDGPDPRRPEKMTSFDEAWNKAQAMLDGGATEAEREYWLSLPKPASPVGQSEAEVMDVLRALVDAWEHGHWDDTGATTINRYRIKIGRLADPELNNA